LSSGATKSIGSEVGGHNELLFKLRVATHTIAYNTFDLIDSGENSNFRFLALDGVEPTIATITSGAYRFRGPIQLAIHKDNSADPALQELMQIMLSMRKDYFPKLGIVSSDTK
jgi:hypothetical protein